MSSSQATNVQLYGGSDGNAASVTPGGNLGAQLNFDSVQNIGKLILRTGKITRLQDIPCSLIMVYNPTEFGVSNTATGNIWYAGYDTQAPQVGVGTPILPGTVEEIECTDANQICFIPEVDGNPMNVIVFASNSSAIVTPANPPDFTNTPPTLSVIQPNVNPATNVSTTAPIIVQASAQLDPTTVNNTTVTTSGPNSMTGAIIALDSNNPQNIIITPTTPLSLNTQYVINYGTGIQDLNGNGLASVFTFTITTVTTTGPPDTTPPTVVSANPGGNSYNVNPSITPSISFSEAMLESSFNSNNIQAFIVNNDQQILNLSFFQSTDLQTLYIQGMNLQNSVSYQINILGGNGIGPTDLAGNYLQSSYNIDFTTGAISSVPSYNVSGNDYINMQGSGGYTNVGETLNSNRSVLVGTIPINYTFILKKYGTPTGTISFNWYREQSGGNYNVYRSLGSISASSLTSSDQTVNIPDSGNTHSLIYNDFISIDFDGGDAYNYVMVKISNYDAFDGSNTCGAKVLSGNTNYYANLQVLTTVDIAGTITTAGG